MGVVRKGFVGCLCASEAEFQVNCWCTVLEGGFSEPFYLGNVNFKGKGYK